VYKTAIMKKIILKSLPFLCSIGVGLFLYKILYLTEGNLKSLVINVSATFLSIPLLYIFYEIIKKYSHKKLTSAFYFYIKEQADASILGMMGYFLGLWYDETLFLQKKNDLNKYTKFPTIKKEVLRDFLINRQHLGFFLYNNWRIVF
jgi:hypothetical protein